MLGRRANICDNISFTSVILKTRVIYTEIIPHCLSVVPSPTYLPGPDVEKTRSAEAHSPIVQQFEISDPIAKACWYKDGTQIYPKREGVCDSQSSSQSVPLQSHDLPGDGRFGGDTSGDAQLNVDIKGGVPHCTCTIKNQAFSHAREAITQLIVFSLALSKQQSSVTMVMRLVR